MGILFVIYLIIAIFSIIMFGNVKSTMVEESNQTVHLECKLNNKTYNYLIESDKEDNILDASGSDYIINIVKDKKFNKGKILVEYIESYFKDNGGSC